MPFFAFTPNSLEIVVHGVHSLTKSERPWMSGNEESFRWVAGPQINLWAHVRSYAFSPSFVTSDGEMDEGHEALVIEEDADDSFSSLSEESESGNEPPLATSEKHAQIRIRADMYRAKAEKHCAKYSKRKRKTVRTFDVGDCVSVRIPCIGRAGTDWFP